MKTVDPDEKVRRWLKMEDILAQDEAERVAKLTPEEVQAELDAEGFALAGFPSQDALLARAAERAGRAATSSTVTVLHPRRARVAWLLVAAAAAVALVAFVEGHAIVAWLRPTPTPITPVPEPVLREPPPTEVAAHLRDEANEACVNERWDECQRKVDAAKELDPAGESLPLTQAIRVALYRHEHASKPPRPDDKRSP